MHHPYDCHYNLSVSPWPGQKRYENFPRGKENYWTRITTSTSRSCDKYNTRVQLELKYLRFANLDFVTVIHYARDYQQNVDEL